MNPLALISAAILGLAAVASAQVAAESKPAPAAASKAAAKTAAKAETPKTDKAAKAVDSIPMYVKVDTIDAANKSFSHTTKVGAKVIHKVTATTVIMQGDKPAQFGDIKVGDYVSGTRHKKSATEYEIVKISKFGPKTPKAENKAPAKKP